MTSTLMIFAAGRGTRMAPLTDRLPKPLIEVAGQTLLDRAIALGLAGGADRIVVNTHHLGDQIAAHLSGRDIALSPEPSLLETGGGLRRALPLLGAGDVITLNPDVVWTGPNPIAALRAAWQPDRMEALLCLIPLQAAQSRIGGGDFAMDAGGRLARKGDWVYAGASVIRPDLLARVQGENAGQDDSQDGAVFSLNVPWDLAIARGTAFGLVHQGGWCDVGRPDCIPLAEQALAQHPPVAPPPPGLTPSAGSPA